MITPINSWRILLIKKTFLFSLLCIFLFCISSIAEEQESPEGNKPPQLMWDPLFYKVNRKLARIESALKIEKDLQQEFNSKIIDDLKKITKTMNERIDKVEKIGSIQETDNLAKSFKGTIDVLNKKTSDMEKKFEDMEVSVSTIEKIYHVSQKPLETLMQLIEKQAAVINKINERLKRQEEMLSAMEKAAEGEDPHGKVNRERVTAATGQEEKVITLNETESRTEKPAIERSDTPKRSEKHPGQESGIFIENIHLDYTGPTTMISGKIINRSDSDYTVAIFKIQLYDENDNLLKSIDSITTNLNIGCTNEFAEFIIGVDSKRIARHVILFNDMELTTYREEKEVQNEEKKMTKGTDTNVKEERNLPAEQKTVEMAETAPEQDKGFEAIGNDFYLRNVTFTAFGSSTSIKGEIQNNSRKDFSSALFVLKVIGEESGIILETEFSIVSIGSGEIMPFDQIIIGIHPSLITDYVITFKDQ
ncbi:hypothetical protein SCALIN_C27_0103 [Candidatus Scalindua japonica]|uniref:Uncharacterized protein n=1 Tax=Candidatus Scalindua japonica TaxID=1284222 RepID=A0A286U0R5_9BACT|nr:hypothetical protein [Candidatus Scalindua japonica]GAX61708.1 hypothetical protein SCALIN_C27_0103 [Candidatus Scalindua japonica]